MDKPDIPPFNEEAEHAVCGSMLIAPAEVIPLVNRMLKAADFFQPACRVVFTAINAMHAANEVIDPIYLTHHLRTAGQLDGVGGPSFVTHLFTFTPTPANAEHYADIVREISQIRRIWAECRAVAAEACTPLAQPQEMAQRLSRLLSDLATARPAESLTFAQHVDLALDRYEHATTHKNEVPAGSLRTGLPALDEWVTFCPGDLVILAAETSGGKTALALQFCAHAAAEAEKQVLVVSYEMTAAQLTDRVISQRTGVPAGKLRSGFITEGELISLGAKVPALKKAGIHLRDAVGHWTIDDVSAEARAVKAAHGLGLIVVDYLQIAAPRRGFNNREREVADISRGLKSLAVELGVPILALSQLNDDGKLRESRAVSHDANTILVIKDDPKGREDWKLITVAKNRDGARDKDVEVYWNGPCMRFSGPAA